MGISYIARQPTTVLPTKTGPTGQSSGWEPTWSEFDTWYRQTDIVYDPRRLENAVVSLKKELPVIDIG